MKRLLIAVFAFLGLVRVSAVEADPCGMVPPVYLSGGSSPIQRVGEQITYVFYKDGIETFVIRPGFSGKVDEFGMLIPFPTPPAIRKVSDDVFAHVAAAVDPPEIIVNLQQRGIVGDFAAANFAGAGAGLQFQQGAASVKVLREEAVGMYEVAVLAAGSAAGLRRWMDDKGYKYPTGMDKACQDYVEAGWCFVAVKTRVGAKSRVDPKPGQRNVQARLPDGSTFDGHVQAMGFRFRVDEPVVPMRLSTFNEGELRNIVYLLADEPYKIRAVPEEYVVRQISGEQLLKNVTAPLPLRVIGGTASDIPAWRKKNLSTERDPKPHNGVARELFAADLLSVKLDRLGHPYEEREKMLLRIGERLGLRGPQVDKLNANALELQRETALGKALEGLNGMTLTVIDGDFPREVLAAANLEFAVYRMPSRRNRPQGYDAKLKAPAPQPSGILIGKRGSTRIPTGAGFAKRTSRPR